MSRDTRLFNGEVYVFDGGAWVPLTEKLQSMSDDLKRKYSDNYDSFISSQSAAISELRRVNSDLKWKLDRAAETNGRLGFQIEKLQNEIKELKEENERLRTVDKLDFYMKYQYPEDSISPNTSIRHQADAIKKVYDSRNCDSDRFSEIKLGTEQHRDNTPEQMINTFTGIYDIWEKHPELELMELLAKLINSRKGFVPIDDEEFVKALQETYDD